VNWSLRIYDNVPQNLQKNLKGRDDLDSRTVEEKIMCLFKGNLLTVLVLSLIERLILILF
jgi:hypothetical protein